MFPMNIVEGSIKYYPSLPYRRFNARLLFGWILFFHKDAWRCDIQLYNSKKQLDLVWWRRFNSLYGLAWVAVILGITLRNRVANKARKGVNNEL